MGGPRADSGSSTTGAGVEVHSGAFEPRARARAHLILFRLIPTTYA